MRISDTCSEHCDFIEKIAHIEERQAILIEDSKEIKSMLSELIIVSSELKGLRVEAEKIKELDLKVNVIYKIAAVWFRV